MTFSEPVMKAVRQQYDCEVIAAIGTARGDIPIYKLHYKEKDIAFFLSMITSAGAGNCVEEARFLTGAKKFIMFGSCGCLDREVTAGKIIVPSQAYRDEGFSYHYVAPADYITLKNANAVAAALGE